MKTLTLERVKTLLHYDPATGIFTWLARTSSDFGGDESRCRSWNTQHASKPAGCNTQTLRYANITIDRKTYCLHRLVWFYCHGVWPDGLLDHKNGVRYDNRLSNLRVVTPSGNSENRRAAMRGKKHDLPLGVFLMPRPGLPNPYMARICTNGNRKYLGSFATPERASEAYLAAKRELHESNTL